MIVKLGEIMSKYDILIGKKYNKLTCVKHANADAKSPSKTKYEFECECGNIRTVVYAEVKHGKAKACKKCAIKNIKGSGFIPTNKTHGMSLTKIYSIWNALRQRCDNPKESKAHLYKNITYNKKWQTFEEFYKDMSKTYFEGASIDRIDSTKNYCKENCQWLTVSEHAIKTAKDLKNANYV